ncbi:hypothetical protein H4Q26_001464 [Puccinia striiformis f. sp. tritici PST-130]|nr:hypothetical protein H4Q26_001464 [Puccinia striiformis f. sp. tritici PST-130]
MQVRIVDNYCPERCWGIPHILHPEAGQLSAPGELVPGCTTRLLTHQQRALEFIRDLESPHSAITSAFWDSTACNWIRQAFNNMVDSRRTDSTIKHTNQAAILADDMGLGKMLSSLALIVTSKSAAVTFANTNDRHAKATLVVCPLLTLANWEAEIHKHLDLKLTKYVVYHGAKRTKWSPQMLWDNNIVLVTYDTVANNYEFRMDALFEAMWFRIILDEAHLIRDPATKRSKAILALHSQQKLCLTGTPLQNRLNDLYTLLCFIRLDPWGREEVWQAFKEPNIQRKAPITIELLQQLLGTFSLRRLKTDVLQLPPKVKEQVGLQLPAPWREDYCKQYHDFTEKFGVERSSGSWDSAEFFQQLTMLRLYCDHPGLLDPCEYDLPKQDTTWRDSPKIMHLMTDLMGHLHSEEGGPLSKAVVFSQWTSFLKIVGAALAEAGIPFVQLDGSCSLQQRENALTQMRQEPNVRVLLATVGAGGVEIDLTCAQKVYLMPCWNPTLENQATDRAYRLGQSCTTQIVRYFIQESIEVNILEIQKRKKELAHLALDRTRIIPQDAVRMMMEIIHQQRQEYLPAAPGASPPEV